MEKETSSEQLFKVGDAVQYRVEYGSGGLVKAVVTKVMPTRVYVRSRHGEFWFDEGEYGRLQHRREDGTE